MITITQGNLFKALSLVANTVEGKAVSEYLEAVLIRHFGEHLNFQTTNNDASTEAVCKDFQGNLENTICVNFQDLFEIIKKYKPDEELELSIQTKVKEATETEKQCEVKYLTLSKGNRSFAELPTLNDAYFPKIVNIENAENEISICKEELKSAIDKTHICIWGNETRYNINGLHFNFQSENKKIDVVSTDGHRLAKFEIKDVEIGFDKKITIPRKILLGIKKDIDHAHSEVIFKINGGKLQIDFGSHTLTTKLLDADFPDYERVIPKDHDKTIKIQRPSFLPALDRVISVLQQNSDLAVKMNFQNNELSMSCVNQQKKTKEVLDCEFEGSYNFLVNGPYIKECVSAISSREFEINIKRNDMCYPITLKDPEDGRFFYVIMLRKM